MLIGIDGNEANVKNRVGSGQYAFELLKQFSKNKNHRFVIYLKDSPLPDLPKNLNYKVFGPKKFWTQFALPIKLTFGLPDKAFGFSRWRAGSKPNVFFSPAHYGPRFSPVPYVVTIHDLSYLHFPELFKKNDLYQLTNWSKYSIQNSAHIIAPSKSTKDDIVKNYKVSPSKITVTYEGYDKERFKPQPKIVIDKIKKKYKIIGDYLIFVGTLQPRKNIERLIEAFSLLVRARDTRGTLDTLDTLSLVIVGKKGWLYDSIFQKVKDLDLEDKVIFTDFVPDADLPALISGAKAYVNPSLWEGFGIPPVEAQACGVPIVVSNTSSLPEIVGDSAVLVDPLSIDAVKVGIEKILKDEKLRARLTKTGLENAKRFSWRESARITLEVLEKQYDDKRN